MEWTTGMVDWLNHTFGIFSNCVDKMYSIGASHHNK